MGGILDQRMRNGMSKGSTETADDRGAEPGENRAGYHEYGAGTALHQSARVLGFNGRSTQLARKRISIGESVFFMSNRLLNHSI
jgi:hypothetical protein